MDQAELRVLEALDRAVGSEGARAELDAIARRVERQLLDRPDDVLAWEPVPLRVYATPLPAGIRSSWVFVLRANATTGAERHPNSHQRMMSYRGAGEFQTRLQGDWLPYPLTSDRTRPPVERWISIPPSVWHQGVVPGENWVVVSFHTVAAHELIEERPEESAPNAVRRRNYEPG